MESGRDGRLRTRTRRLGGVRDVAPVGRSCSAADISIVCIQSRQLPENKTRILPSAAAPNRTERGDVKALLTSRRAFAVLALAVRLPCRCRDVRGKSGRGVALPLLASRRGERRDGSRFERVAGGEGRCDRGGCERGRVVLEAAGRLVVGLGAGFTLWRRARRQRAMSS